jgi:hypothetical protein
LRNSDQSNSSQRRGQKTRRPSGKNNQRGGNGQKSSAPSGPRNTANNSNRSGQGSSTGQRNSSTHGKSRNEVSQAWASDTKTLSSHMPTIKKNEWGKKKNDSKTGSGTGSRGKNKPSNGKNRSGQSNRNQTRNRPPSRPNNDSAAQKTAPTQRDSVVRENGKQVGNIDPFELFCAYHLGITQDKGYRTSNINEVANRFRSEPGMIKQALKEYDMDPESLLDREFDMGLAQLDIQVAPEGVDRLELARGIYQDFQDAPRIKRDWNKILEEDRKENQKIFKN